MSGNPVFIRACGLCPHPASGIRWKGKDTKLYTLPKALSDEIYYQQDRQEQKTSRYNVSINGMEEMDIAAVPSIDLELIRKNEEEKALGAARRLLDSGKLTPVQRRRFLLHFFQGFSTRQIAKMEGVHQRAVWDSLVWAQKKLKKYYEE